MVTASPLLVSEGLCSGRRPLQAHSGHHLWAGEGAWPGVGQAEKHCPEQHVPFLWQPRVLGKVSSFQTPPQGCPGTGAWRPQWPSLAVEVQALAGLTGKTRGFSAFCFALCLVVRVSLCPHLRVLRAQKCCQVKSGRGLRQRGVRLRNSSGRMGRWKICAECCSKAFGWPGCHLWATSGRLQRAVGAFPLWCLPAGALSTRYEHRWWVSLVQRLHPECLPCSS